MIKTKPGFMSQTTGIVLMERDDKAMEPYVHADSLLDWLDQHGFDNVALNLRNEIFRTLDEYGSILDQI